MHHAILLRNWTDQLTLATGGEWTPTAEQRGRLARHQIGVVEQPIARLEGEGEQLQTIAFPDGTSMPCRVLFIRPKTEHRTPFAMDLGCAIDGHNFVQVDNRGRTSVAGVYAAGDLSSPVRSVAIAVAQGSSAGYGINFDLVTEDMS
jgi:thioredoxin reductase